MKILIIGLGSIATKHINAIRQIDRDAVIYALRSGMSAKIDPDIVNLYSFEEVRSFHFDFAIISNPTSEHKKTIDTVLALGCPLFIEKPLSNSVEMQDTLSKIEKLNLLTYVACNLRFLDVLQYVKKEVQSREKRINEVNIYCGSFLPDWRPGVDFRTSYSARSELGGGVHFDLIHEIDYTYWLFGKPEKVIKTLRNVSSLQIDAIDYANYCLEYGEFNASIILNYYRRDYKRTLEIVFDDSTWFVDLKLNNIMSDGIEIFSSQQQINDTYMAQMECFYHLLQMQANTSNNSIFEAVEVLKICL